MNISNMQIRNIVDPWREGIDRGWKVLNGTTLEDGSHYEADVIIIGSGAGGGVSAELFAKAGFKVLILEAARLKSTDEFDMEESAAYRDLYQEGATRVTKDGAIPILQGRAVGGTTVVNWTSSFRTPAQTLDHWHQEYQTTGLSRTDLDPYFEQMEKRLNVSKWHMPPNNNNAVIKNGCEALGWEWDIIPRNVSGCWNLGYCGTGCPTNAKQSMLVTTLPAAMEQGATLIHNAEAWELAVENHRVTGIKIRTLDERRQPTGRWIFARAPIVIAAGGAINTPALLLRSQLPDPEKLLGKRTFLHVTSFAFGDFQQEVAGYYGAPQSLYSDQFTWRDGVTGKVGYKLETIPVHPGLAASLLGGFGNDAFANMQRLPHTAVTLALLRDGFHPESQGGAVELNKYHEPVLNYTLSDYMLEGVRHSHLTQVEMLFAAGARAARPSHGNARFYRSWKEARDLISNLKYTSGVAGVGSAHVMGGVPLGENLKRCLTDSNGKYHYLDNLYVFDGSVLPTSLGVNPQLTLYGLAARQSDQLIQALRASKEQTG